jgi:hypothetical protein
MRHRGTSVLTALLAAGALNSQALALTNPVVDWSPVESFAFEPNFILPHQSVALNELKIVGKISLFNDPLDGNDASDPGLEYTFVFDQLISGGSVFANLGNFDEWRTSYSGGRWRIYKDTTPDRSYGTSPPNLTSPSTFEDGELILTGTFSNFRTVSYAWTPDTNPGGTCNASIKVTGGTQMGLLNLCPDANGNHGQLLGTWQRNISAMPVGYIRAHDGKFDLFDCPVPVGNSTWGRIKIQY